MLVDRPGCRGYHRSVGRRMSSPSRTNSGGLSRSFLVLSSCWSSLLMRSLRDGTWVLSSCLNALALPRHRLHWASSHLFFAAIGPTIVLAGLGMSMGLTYGLSSRTSGSVGNALPGLLAASLVRLPAIWVMAGIAAALYGLLPRFAAPVTSE